MASRSSPGHEAARARIVRPATLARPPRVIQAKRRAVRIEGLCRNQGCAAFGQLALQWPRSAPGQAPGGPDLRAASANQPPPLGAALAPRPYRACFRPCSMRWPGRCARQWAAGRRTPASRAAQAAAAASCRRHVLRRRGSPCTDARCCLAARSWSKVPPDGTAPKLGRASAAAVAAGVSASADVSPAMLRAHRRPSGRRHVSVLCPQPTRCGCRRGGSGRPTAQR